MRRKMEDGAMNMTPMIDVVFQLIIFFVVSIDMQNKQTEMELRLAMSPHGKAVQVKDPRTINIDVDDKGHIYIARGRMSITTLQSLMRKMVAQNGQTQPVVIRGDANATHDMVRRVIDVCTSAGLWKIKFAAIREKAGAK